MGSLHAPLYEGLVEGRLEAREVARMAVEVLPARMLAIVLRGYTLKEIGDSLGLRGQRIGVLEQALESAHMRRYKRGFGGVHNKCTLSKCV